MVICGKRCWKRELNWHAAAGLKQWCSAKRRDGPELPQTPRIDISQVTATFYRPSERLLFPLSPVPLKPKLQVSGAANVRLKWRERIFARLERAI